MTAFIRRWWPASFPLLGLSILLFSAGLEIGRSVREREAHRREFMVACSLDRKLYECEALWGQAQRYPGESVHP